MTQHGTNSRYSMGCRCRRCKSAHAAAQRTYHSKHPERSRPVGKAGVQCPHCGRMTGESVQP